MLRGNNERAVTPTAVGATACKAARVGDWVTSRHLVTCAWKRHPTASSRTTMKTAAGQFSDPAAFRCRVRITFSGPKPSIVASRPSQVFAARYMTRISLFAQLHAHSNSNVTSPPTACVQQLSTRAHTAGQDQVTLTRSNAVLQRHDIDVGLRTAITK